MRTSFIGFACVLVVGVITTHAEARALDVGQDVPYAHSCAIQADRSVWCWGYNGWGQLGNPTNVNRTVNTPPVKVTGVLSATSVTTGRYHSCAVLSDGRIRCWGLNHLGQLGNGTTTNSVKPVVVTGISSAIDVSSGEHHSCAVLEDGTVRCWGWNESGQLGHGNFNTGRSEVPVVVSGISTAIAIASGYSHSCALLAHGAVRCWGYNHDGQLGNYPFSSGIGVRSAVPLDVTDIFTAGAIDAGTEHTCALLHNMTIQCWGKNTYGQVGSGSSAERLLRPTTVLGITNAIAIAAGDAHNCAVLSGGLMRCWGRNEDGQLGTGDYFTKSNTPKQVIGITGATQAAAGAHSCALVSGGFLRCWGYLESPDRTRPQTITGVLSKVVDLVTRYQVLQPTNVDPGEQIFVSNTVTNYGSLVAGGSSVGFYLSPDTNITTGDLFLGSRYTRSLSPGERHLELTPVTIPATAASGVYYLGVVTDYQGDVGELDERNNAVLGPLLGVEMVTGVIENFIGTIMTIINTVILN